MVNKLKTLFPGKDHCFDLGSTTASENKRTFRLICEESQRSTIVRIKLDKCLINNPNSKKCDWLFIIPDSKGIIFVECKGNDVLEAIRQIRITHNLMKPVVRLSSKRFAFVIPTKVAPVINTSIQREEKKFKRDYGITLIIKNRKCEFQLPNYNII